jgi:hypothetical protein
MTDKYDKILEKYSDEEIWKWIPEFMDQYQISSYGRVKSHKANSTGHIIAPKITAAGYWYVHLYIGIKPNGPRIKSVGISRLVASAFVPNPEDLAEVGHINEEKGDNHHSNLQWVAHDSNVRKNQAYKYKVWNIADPEKIYWLNSKRDAVQLLHKSHGWLYYNMKMNNFPTRDGWMCEVNRVLGSQKNRW